MTYCLAMRLDEGLVFLADTRTNAGVDNISTYRKLHVLRAGAGPRLRAASRPATWPPPRRCSTASSATWPARRPREPGHGRATSSRPRCTSAGSSRRWRPSTARRCRGRRRRHRHLHPRRPDRRRARPTSSSCTRRATTSGRPTTGRSCRSARASTASSCSSSRSQAHVDLAQRHQDRARLDDEHRPGQPLGRAALRPRRLPHTATLDARGVPRRPRTRRCSSGCAEVWERHLLTRDRRAADRLPLGDFAPAVRPNT